MYLIAGEKRIYHIIDWLSCKQSRLSFLSSRAEILAAAHSTDCFSFVEEHFRQLAGPKASIILALTIQSNEIYSTITTLHEGTDYRLWPTAARMRDSSETGKIGSVQWIPGAASLAEALTKKPFKRFAS